MGRRSKQKGNSYELKISKDLAKWSGERVHRVPQSGAGGHSWGADSRMNGDIVFPVDSENSLIYELKKREGWDLRHLFLNTGNIKEWIQQVHLDSRRMAEHGYSPCLIFSKNHDKDYVILPYVEEVYNRLDREYPVMRQTISYKNIREETLYFDILMTTLDGLTSMEPKYVFDIYRYLKWDTMNG